MTRLEQIQWGRITLLLLAVAFSQPASAQQQYNNVSGYACTGAATSCQTYAFYRTQGSESTLASIAALFNTSSSGIANVSGIDPGQTTPFPDQTLIYIPLACHCTNDIYQASTSHVVAQSETMFIIANSTYEGLTTFQAIGAANPTVNATAMKVGQLLSIPLRCACPSTVQREAGSRLLLSYAVFHGETLSLISDRFNVSVADIQTANNITDPSTLQAFSTLLIPLPALVPLNSSTLAPPPPPPNALAPTPAPAPPIIEAGRAKDPSNTPLYIGIAVGAAGLTLAAILACLLCATIARYKKIIREKEDVDKRSLMKPSISISNGDRNTGSSGTPGFLVGMTDVLGSDKPAKFSYEELLTATNHFSDENRIQGSVFLGKLNGSFVAIKQMKGSMSDELKILSQVHHGNVVRLVGVCASRSESLFLVYEYAENGSLSDCLHYQIAYPNSSFTRTVGLLSWKLRMQIALDVASGLEYLHNYTKPSLVHKDVKTSNILLDRQFRAKVANFGMAKSAEEDVPGPMMTEHIVGTQGYMAPEYLEHGLVTTRADVFSFGVVLLEILSGREAMFSSNDGEVTHLSATIFDVLDTEDRMAKLAAWMDPRLQNAYPRDIAFSAAGLAKTCVETDPSKRPDIKEISFALSKLCQASQEWEPSNRYTGVGIEAR